MTLSALSGLKCHQLPKPPTLELVTLSALWGGKCHQLPKPPELVTISAL